MLARAASLPESADSYLGYRREASPLVSEIQEFLQQRRETAMAEIRSPERLATYLLTARTATTTPENGFKALAKGKQLSERQLQRWMSFLQRMEQEKQPPEDPPTHTAVRPQLGLRATCRDCN